MIETKLQNNQKKKRGGNQNIKIIKNRRTNHGYTCDHNLKNIKRVILTYPCGQRSHDQTLP